MNRSESLQKNAPVLILGLLALVLYLSLPDKVFVFDGISFAGIIDRLGDDSQTAFFNRRHLLFIPLLRFVGDLLAKCGVSIPGYSLIQRCNVFFGVLGIGLFYRLAARLAKNDLFATLLAAILAVSFGYWARATEGQVYMVMTCSAIAVILAAVSFVERPGGRPAALLGLVFVVAVLLHSANVFLFPMVACALVLKIGTVGRARTAGVFCALFAGIALPFMVVFRVYSPTALHAFLMEATEYYSGGGWDSSAAIVGRFFAGNGGILGWSSLARDAARSFISLSGPVSVFAGTLLVIASLGLFAAITQLRETRSRGMVLCLAWLGFVLMNVFWRGGEFFWSVPAAAVLAAMALLAGGYSWPDKKGPALRWATGLTAIVLGCWNLYAGIVPRSRIENNVGYMRAKFVEKHTVPLSWIMIAGGEFPNAKVYLPYFAQRRRQAVEYYFNSRSKEEGLKLLRRNLDDSIGNGIPVYQLSGFTDGRAGWDSYQRLYGLTLKEVQDCLGPGHLLPVAQEDPAFGVYLFVPRDRFSKGKLFAVLTYSYLREDDPVRAQETSALLRSMVAREMDAPLLSETIAAMRAHDYGTGLVWAGLISSMGPDFQARARDEFARFAAWEKTRDFHQRMAVLYRALGLPGEAKTEEAVLARQKD